MSEVPLYQVNMWNNDLEPLGTYDISAAARIPVRTPNPKPNPEG